jgi:response regulator RpfG family c-di-GMP phosphodiesterase
MKDRFILCVDDEVNILHSLTRLLRNENYQLVTASSAEEGLRLLEKQRFQVVLSDQKMPEMTGTQFLQRVKERYPDTIRIVLSGNADVDVILDSINKGEIYRFLTKPWNDLELKVIIAQCFEHFDLVQQNRSLLDQISSQNVDLKGWNEDLEKKISERTRSLRLSQEILSKLSVPVIGISSDGLVVLSNEAAVRAIPSLHKVSNSMRDIFPKEVIDGIQCFLDGKETDDVQMLALNDRKFRLQIDALREGKSIRGCVLVLHPIEALQPSSS